MQLASNAIEQMWEKEKVVVTLLSRWCWRLLLCQLEDQPVTHPGLEFLQSAKHEINMSDKLVRFILRYISLHESVCEASPSSRSH